MRLSTGCPIIANVLFGAEQHIDAPSGYFAPSNRWRRKGISHRVHRGHRDSRITGFPERENPVMMQVTRKGADALAKADTLADWASQPIGQSSTSVLSVNSVRGVLVTWSKVTHAHEQTSVRSQNRG